MKAGRSFVGRKSVVVTALALIGVFGLAAVALAKPDFGGKWIGGGSGTQAEGVDAPSRVTFRIDNDNRVKDFSWTRWSYYCEDQQVTYEMAPYTMRDKNKVSYNANKESIGFSLRDEIQPGVSFHVWAKARRGDRPKDPARAKGTISARLDFPGGLCHGSTFTPDVKWEAEQQG